ncbi:hypothetical protein COO60DRAFT_444391 [Scenedesmus sp. NREL 46B-D3]|nr:hypothetical protein COO60DRAFT_444391 [Scenedesmus sp. NREL 46B-D3]
MTDAADNAKRELEPNQTGEAAEEQPAAKRLKTEADAAAADAGLADAADNDADMAEDTEAAAAAAVKAEDGEEAAEADDAAEKQAAAEPVKLGYRTFKNASEASDYIATILRTSTPEENLNEYELLLLLDLLQKGHPRASEKLAKGIKGIQVADTRVGGAQSTCFHIQALDGTLEDFSYRKCLLALYPGEHG